MELKRRKPGNKIPVSLFFNFNHNVGDPANRKWCPELVPHFDIHNLCPSAFVEKCPLCHNIGSLRPSHVVTVDLNAVNLIFSQRKSDHTQRPADSFGQCHDTAPVQGVSRP